MAGIKILHILPTLGTGGAERFTVDLVNQLDKTDEVFLCTLYDILPGKNDFFLKELSPTVTKISLSKRIGADISIYRKMRNLIKSIKPDIIHTHLSSINYIWPFIFVFRKIKYFHTIHTDAKFEIKNWIEFRTRKMAYRNKKINPVTISKQSSQSFKDLYKLNCDYMIYNGRKSGKTSAAFSDVIKELQNFRTNDNRKILLHVGRLAKVKNQFFLAQCVDRLITEGYKICLVIIGDFSSMEGKKIKNEILSLGNDHILLLGVKTNICDYLAASDAFCLASTFEGMPISFIEALSMGCIPICTPVGGIKEVISSASFGFLATDMSANSYEAEIKNFLACDNRDEIKTNIKRKYEEDFDIVSTSIKYRERYLSILAFPAV